MLSLKTRRVLVVAFTMATFLFATTTGAIWHHHNEATASGCQICHIAHLPVLPAAARVALPAPIVITSAISAAPLDPYLDPVAQYSSPRAPPA